MNKDKLNQAIFIFSWDFELAWGFHDKTRLPSRLHKYDSRRYIGKIIDILDNYNVQSTWATVGHLFLDECHAGAHRPHPSLPVPSQSWYNEDPCSNVKSDPLWYAPDLIERIRSCNVRQEIGSHTFSHIETTVPNEILRAELRACHEVSKNISIQSFISPRHGEVPTSLLSDLGYKNYREPSTKPGIGQAMSFYSGIGGPRIGTPSHEHSGIWRHPVSTFFFYNPLHKVQTKLPSIKRRWFESGLQRAIEMNEVFHVWAHPHNFIGNASAINQFHWLISRVAELREQELIIPMTMSEARGTVESS